MVVMPNPHKPQRYNSMFDQKLASVIMEIA